MAVRVGVGGYLSRRETLRHIKKNTRRNFLFMGNESAIHYNAPTTHGDYDYVQS